MKRFLKIVAILALFFVAIAYVVFRVVFFDPFGSAHGSLDSLVPKDVDVMFRRKQLAQDFEPFPQPLFWKSLRIKDEWEALTRTRLYQELEPKLGVEQTFAELERLPAQLDPLDLMHDLAGREALFVGKWRTDGTLAFAALVRASFRAKLFAEAVKLAVVRSATKGLIESYSEKDGVRSLKVQGRTWHLWRTDDVVVAGNDFDLVHEISAMGNGGELAIADSPQYRAAVLNPSPVGRPIDFVVDVAESCKLLGLKWPPATEADAALFKFTKELLAPERFGQAMGRLALGNQIELFVRATADFPALRAADGGVFEGGSNDLAALYDFCGKVFPSKVAATGYVKLRLKDFLRRIEGLLDKDTRQLLNDFVPQLKTPDRQFQPKSTIEVLDAFASVVTDEFAFAIEPGEAYHVPGTPEGEMQFPDPRWGPRVAFVCPVADKDLAVQLVDRVIKAVSAQQSAISNVWKWTYPNGDEFREVKSVVADLPTVSIGVLQLQKKDCVVLTTTGAFLDEIVQQKVRVEHGENSGLQSELQFRQAQPQVAGFGQGFFFVSSPNLRRIVADLCPVMAEDSTRPDWTTIRHDLEQRVLSRKHPELLKKPLDEAGRKLIEPEVDAQIAELDKKWKEVTMPAKLEELHADLEAFDMLRWCTLTFRVNERDLELRMQLSTPANFTTGEVDGG